MKILILAGGSGTRLWPLSREKYPKQFLNLIDNLTLIQATAKRIMDHEVYVVTNQETAFLVVKQLKEILGSFSKKNTIIEPLGRNTAPAIAYAATFFNNEDILAILPADHHIENEKVFLKLLKHAEKIAKKGYIVTFGITPTRPETGYGYIKIKDKKYSGGSLVESFTEKPDSDTAREYLKDGRYFWNSGMFIFSVKTIKEELAKYASDVFSVMEKLEGKAVDNKTYQAFPSISIDYAVMEKTDKIVLLEADMGWNDIGGFEALYDILEKDKNGNAVTANIDFYPLDSVNNLLYSINGYKKIIASINLKDMVIVDAEDVLLLAKKKESHQVKEIVKLLKKQKREEAILHKKVYRPWGYYKSISIGINHQIKEIVVYPSHRLSLQSHKQRSESWTVVEGEAVIQIKDEEYLKKKEETIFIPKKAKHRLTNPSDKEITRIIEVQMGEYLGEDDIVRYEDDYGRVS